MPDLSHIAPLFWTEIAIMQIRLAVADIYCIAGRIKQQHLKTVCEKLLAAGLRREVDAESLMIRPQRVYVNHPGLFFLPSDFSSLRNVRFLEALNFENGDYAKPQHGRKGTRH